MVKLVPYNDAMRLGQGFNSYTQQICIDDAVIVDPTRAENVLTNNGTTMRILAQKTNKASVWRQMKEYVIDGKETTVSTEPKNLIDKPKEEEDKENIHQDSTTAVEESKKKKLGALNSVEIYENRQKEIAKRIASNTTTDDVDAEVDAKAIKSVVDKEAAPTGKAIEEVEEPEDEDLKLDTQIQESEAKKAETKKKIEENNKQFRKGILEDGKDISLNTFKSSEQQLKEANEERDKKIDQGRISLGIGKDLANPEAWPIENAIGTSQTVTYVSHFVDKVSEINNDMRLSAALSIKAGKFGGSGRGSFFTSEEFNESDLRFYISVKVTNQSINFKDALQYNPVPGLNPQKGDEFSKIFGDSFISGFVEGGEFNALVLMKIKNEAKLQDIKAEVKVAFTTADKKEEAKKEGDNKANEGEKVTEVDKKPEDNKTVEKGKKTEEKTEDGKSKDKKGIKIDAEGNLKLAKRNIAMNAETTIYVSWTGGAAIKPYDEKWTIESLMAAAQRFPALVALYPQRIYAQVTEYRHLRSFVKLKPPTLLPITYENVSMYTNTLLDVYMEYKTLFKKVSMDILDLQSGTKVFKEELKVETEEQKKARERKERGELSTVEEEKEEEAIDPSLPIRKVQLSKALITAGLTTVFPPTVEGLGEARQAIRKQMNAIVKEVDDIAEDPSLSLKETDSEWVGPASFQSLIPKIEFKVRKVRGTPLSNKSLDESKETNPNSDQDAFVVHLFDEENSPLSLSETEQLELSEIEQNSPSLADKTRITAPVGSITAGESFNGLEHNLPEPVISHLSVWQKDGVFCCMAVHYDIGLTVEYGGSIQDYLTKYKASTFNRFDLKELGLSEMITSASIEVEGGLSIDFVHDQNNHDHSKSTEEENAEKNKLRVIGIAFSTNRGQKIQALCQRPDQRKNEFTDKHKIHQFEKPLKDTYISGFWGRQSQGGIHRLGLIWTQAPPRTNLFDEEIPLECISGSLKNSDNVKFERTLQDIPSLAYGIRAFGRGTGIEPVIAKTEKPSEIENAREDAGENEDNVNLHIQTNLDNDQINREGFKYIQDGISKIVDWIVLPELDGTFIQTGQVLFSNPVEDEECLGSSKQSQTVEFKLTFSDKDKIKTVCWLIDFETNRPDDENKDSQTEFHIKVGTVGDITTKMMTIQVGDPQTFIIKKVKGNQSSTQENTPSNEMPLHKFWSARVGWLAYESDGGEIEFSHGEMTSPFGIDQSRIIWDTTWSGNSKFSTEPSQTFIALSEIKGKRDYSKYLVDPKAHYSVSLKDVTKDTISLIAEAPQNTTLGAVWISCL